MANKAVKRRVKRPVDKIIDGLKEAVVMTKNDNRWRVKVVAEQPLTLSLCESLEAAISSLESRIAAAIARINNLNL